MKTFFSWIGKRLLSAVITAGFFMLAILGIAYAMSYPSAPPAGEVAGGKFTQYFNSIRIACPAGQYLNGYDANFNKICAPVPAGAQGPQGIQGPAGATEISEVPTWTICWMATQYCNWPGNIKCQGLDPRCGTCPPGYSIQEWKVSFWDTNRFAFCGKN